MGRLLTTAECIRLKALYDDDRLFSSRVEMERHRFGVGEYKYFTRPLPDLVEELRHGAYPPLARIANEWARALGRQDRYPADLGAFLRRCHAAGQTRPTPLLLRYQTGGFNALHQDLYGDVAFPLQLTVFLSRPGRDFTGGEFLLVEQRPRSQSVGDSLQLGQGEAVVFPNRHRPVRGRRGFHRASVRHGVSRLHSGHRYALGVIFHDARG
ncbi:MAG TPA: 2OG-Fe(II) oxygenase [Vicinamibacteria bacterium]